jgi:soluble lytic murein transglycosylase
MPATAKDLARQAGVANFNPDNLYQPSLNLDLGTRYLGNLVRRYGGDDAAVPLAIPSYNAGAGAVDKWLDRRKAWDFDMFIEAIPYDETRAYTQSVLERWLAYRWVHGGDTPANQRIPYIPLVIPTNGRVGADRGCYGPPDPLHGPPGLISRSPVLQDSQVIRGDGSFFGPVADASAA